MAITMNFLSLFSLAVASFFIIFYLYAKYKQTYWAKRGVYSPPAHWFYGHFKDVMLMRAASPVVLGNLYKYCQDRRDLPVIGVYVMQKPFLMLRSPELIKKIMIQEFNNFSDRYFAAKRKKDIVSSYSLFSIDNPQWRYLKAKLSPAFTIAKQKKLFELMVESAQNMNKYLQKQVPEGELVDLEVRSICSKYTTDVIASLSFGIRINSFNEVTPEFYDRSRKLFDEDFTKTCLWFINFFFPKLADIIDVNFLGSDEAFFRKVFWDSMNEREKSGVKRGDLIDFLIELKNDKQDSDFKFEGDYLLSQGIVFLFAGLEAPALTICFTLKEMAKNPDLQEKVRQELREKIGNDPITYDSIAKMTYLQQVMSETLRIYSPASVIDRVALIDYKVPGTDIVIEKGTCVYAALRGLHEDPEYHPEPLKYDPERFSEERKLDMKSGTYLPFGIGPRMCIGERVGVYMAMLGLMTIFREFEVYQNHNYKNDLSTKSVFIVPGDDGVHVCFKRSPLMASKN